MRSRNENDHDDEELFARAADGRLDGVPDGVVRRAASLRDARGATPLHVAAGDGAVAACRRLCAADPAAAAVRTTGRNGRTALHWAARNGRADACRFLVAEAGVPVDVPAHGGVTPFQLAVWRGRFATARALVEELGADETSVNDWGCSASHWLGRADVDDDDDDDTLRGLCEWLWGTRGADARVPNHHGQTPLHKAAYAGNAAVYEYLVARAGVVDDRRDAAGNTAADCAERGRRPDAARWLRRHASVPVAEARRALGLDAGRAPDAKTVREAYLRVARALRPGVDDHDPGRWHRASDAYRLLTLWRDAPDELDAVVRVRSRNAALSERPRLAYTAEWHRANDDDDRRSPDRDDDDDAHVNNEKDRLLDDRLATFERRLVRLLSTDAYRDEGLPISQLPREYTKSFGGSFFPNPKDYGCRKLVFLLERLCPLLAVERVYEDIAPVASRKKVVDGWTPPTRICTVRVRVASESSSSS